MRKAFAAFAVALFLASAVLAVHSIRTLSEKTSSDYSARAAALEKRHYAETGLKGAVRQVLSFSLSESEFDSSAEQAAALGDLEVFWEAAMRDEGMEADFWFGSPSQQEIQDLLRSSLENERPVKCFSCLDFSSKTLDWEKRVVPRSVEFIFAGRISGLGYSHTPTGAAWVGRKPFFGATVFVPSERMAFVIVMGEGFG